MFHRLWYHIGRWEGPSAQCSAASQTANLRSGGNPFSLSPGGTEVPLQHRMLHIYVFWLILANCPADQSVAQAVSCHQPPWLFVSQACCSATDAKGFKAPPRRGCGFAVNHGGCWTILIRFVGHWSGGGGQCVWIYCAIHHMHRYPHACTVLGQLASSSCILSVFTQRWLHCTTHDAYGLWSRCFGN